MTTGDATAAAAAQAAQTIYEQARSHKRLEAYHRREARNLQARLARMRADLKRVGIEFDIETEPGGHSQ